MVTIAVFGCLLLCILCAVVGVLIGSAWVLWQIAKDPTLVRIKDGQVVVNESEWNNLVQIGAAWKKQRAEDREYGET